MNAQFPPLPDLEQIFQVPDFSVWKEAAEQAIKGLDFEKTLYHQTLEGIRLQPLYLEKDRPALLPVAPTHGDQRRGWHAQSGWQISQSYAYPQLQRLCTAIAADRSQGLEAVELQNYRLTAEDWQLLWESLAGLPLYLNSTAPLVDWQQAQPPADACLAGLLVDPLTAWVQGQISAPDALWDELIEAAPALWQHNPTALILQVSSKPYHEAGAHAVQELSVLLASLAESVQQLHSRGLKPAQLFNHLRLEVSADQQFFMQVAKFRALKILVSRMASIYGCPEAQPQLHGCTSRRSLTLYDPYVNLLRQTVAAMAMTLAGVDSLATDSFNAVVGLPDDFARRLARNIQLLLKHEVHLDQLVDPTAGSYFIESLTQTLAEKAWQHFQEIESQGGLLKVLKAGNLQAEIQATANTRQQQLAKGKQVLIGTSRSSNPAEHHTQVLNIHSEGPWPELNTVSQADIRLLQPIRLAEDFENLRAKQESSPVKVQLLPLGPISAHRARLEFAQAFFEVAGCQPQTTGALQASADLANSLDPEAQIYVLCGSDSDYPHWLDSLPHLAADKHWVLAGNPKANPEIYAQAGIQQFIYLGCDSLATLQTLLQSA